ncbi:MAG TPA: hypothetical protein VNJ08_17805 [Bacteriovoracaceae bacterium]|nr:hypothetical protein [Bacteriovoracaceae bacterium]
MKLYTFILLTLLTNIVFAEDRTTSNPLKTIKEVHEDSVPETMAKLKNPRIAILDYDLIRQDFPAVKGMSNPQIDAWILSQVAYISQPQVAQTAVNTSIPVTKETVEAYRPPEYGRAIVFDMKDPSGKKIGLIDAKGTGSLKPGQVDHGNGLSTLGEAIREYNYENLVRGVLIDAKVPNRTVGSYGVIDAGFDVVHADGSTSRAGIYLRQAHSRPTYNGWLDAGKRADLEKVFHKYGIEPNKNIQGTKAADIYDFGHFVVMDDLPGIDPKKAVSFEQWGYDKSVKPSGRDTRWFYSKQDKPWIWGHETAEAFAAGKATREDIWRHHVQMVQPSLKKLPGCGQGLYHILNALLTAK